MTDIATGWTELLSLQSKADANVRVGIEEIIELIPFKLKGIDCDNGTEFQSQNGGMVRARQITFTRSRAYRKNDHYSVNGIVIVLSIFARSRKCYFSSFAPCHHFVIDEFCPVVTINASEFEW